MAWKSPTQINASEGLSNFLPYLSEVTNFWFGRMLLVAIFVIFLFGYIKTKEEDWIGGVAVASYVTFVLGLLFWTIGLVSGMDFAFVIGVTAVSSVILFTQRDKY